MSPHRKCYTTVIFTYPNGLLDRPVGRSFLRRALHMNDVIWELGSHLVFPAPTKVIKRNRWWDKGPHIQWMWQRTNVKVLKFSNFNCEFLYVQTWKYINFYVQSFQTFYCIDKLLPFFFFSYLVTTNLPIRGILFDHVLNLWSNFFSYLVPYKLANSWDFFYHVLNLWSKFFFSTGFLRRWRCRWRRGELESIGGCGSKKSRGRGRSRRRWISHSRGGGGGSTSGGGFGGNQLGSRTVRRWGGLALRNHLLSSFSVPFFFYFFFFEIGVIIKRDSVNLWNPSNSWDRGAKFSQKRA